MGAQDAWLQFCDSLRQAGEHIADQHTGASEEIRAEGYRYLLGLVRSGLGQALELADPDRPRWLRNPDSLARWGAENADNQYLWTRVRADAVYRIRGERGSSFDFLIEVKEGYMQLGDARNFATLTADQLELEPDGSFEIFLCADPRPGNWLPLHADARYVAIRQYFCDWRNEIPARFEIERIASDAAPSVSPEPLTPDRMSELLRDAGEWTLRTAQFWSAWVDEMREAHRPGRIAAARKVPGGADDIFYGNDLYRLAPDEALLIETTLPDARYWQFQLGDLWFRSADWSERKTSINFKQAHIDADGLFRCVVSHRDPGVPNWLDTGGHSEGLLQFRWIWANDNPRPVVRVVAFDSLRSALPSDTPRVSASQRARELEERRRHRARREQV